MNYYLLSYSENSFNEAYTTHGEPNKVGKIFYNKLDMVIHPDSLSRSSTSTIWVAVFIPV